MDNVLFEMHSHVTIAIQIKMLSGNYLIKTFSSNITIFVHIGSMKVEITFIDQKLEISHPDSRNANMRYTLCICRLIVIYCVMSLYEAGTGMRIVGSGRLGKANHRSVSSTPSSSSWNCQRPSNDLICRVSLSAGYKSPWVSAHHSTNSIRQAHIFLV